MCVHLTYPHDAECEPFLAHEPFVHVDDGRCVCDVRAETVEYALGEDQMRCGGGEGAHRQRQTHYQKSDGTGEATQPGVCEQDAECYGLQDIGDSHRAGADDCNIAGSRKWRMAAIVVLEDTESEG